MPRIYVMVKLRHADLRTRNISIKSGKDIAQRIFALRGLKVMLDRDLAELYEVETRVLNQAVRRHLKRFRKISCFSLAKSSSTSLLWVDSGLDIGKLTGP